MNVWLQYAVALVFIGACIAGAVAMVNEDVAAAQHEALLDELWADAPVTA